MIVDNINIYDDKEPVSFVHKEDNCCIICSKHDEETTYLLRKIGNLEPLEHGEQVAFDKLNKAECTYEIGFFFKHGILLSNLSLKENIALPYQYYHPECNWSDFEEEVRKWLEFFKLEIDLNERPAYVNHSKQKIISYIRNLILKPEILIMDDPLFQISNVFRKKIVDCLQILKDDNNFLVIGTSDLEIIESIGDDIIVIDRGELIERHRLLDKSKTDVIKAVKLYLGL